MTTLHSHTPNNTSNDTKACWSDYFCSGKARSTTDAQCVSILALVTEHAMHKRQIILSHVAYPALPHISTLPHYQQHDFEKHLLYTKCMF